MYKSSLYWNADDTDFTDLRRFILKFILEFYRKVLLKTIALAQITSHCVYFHLSLVNFVCNGNPFHFFFKNEKITSHNYIFSGVQ
jgi:hypothetical protein